jgi:hypothetical protein
MVLSFIMKTRLLLSSAAFLFALGVLITSLASANQVASSGEKAPPERKLYFNREILPDNVPIYPLMMVMDRIQLETAPNKERVFIEVEYANRRLGYAEELLKQEKPDLALTTLTKAEQYLTHAVSDMKENQAPDSVQKRVKKTVEYHLKKLEELREDFTLDADRAVVDRAIKDTEALQTQIP